MALTIQIVTFYRFVPLTQLEKLRATLLQVMRSSGVHGTILLAEEGINATVSGTAQGIEALRLALDAVPELANLPMRESRYAAQPFKRTKVKIKRELIGLGVEVPAGAPVGQYVPPAEWNALISRDDVVVIDTRNAYEVHLGKFKGATDPATRSFRELVDYTEQHLSPARNAKVAMYCTGGIRCEKYSAYLIQQGFGKVYHLQGGILNYLEQVPEAESQWQGSCFVFDERIAVGHGLHAADALSMCGTCGHPLTHRDREAYRGEGCIFCEGNASVTARGDAQPRDLLPAQRFEQ